MRRCCARPIENVSRGTRGGRSDLLSRVLADAAPLHFDGQRGGAVHAGSRGGPHVRSVFKASGTVNMATRRIPLAPEDFTPILRIPIDPFVVAVRDDSSFRTPGDLFEATHA